MPLPMQIPAGRRKIKAPRFTSPCSLQRGPNPHPANARRRGFKDSATMPPPDLLINKNSVDAPQSLKSCSPARPARCGDDDPRRSKLAPDATKDGWPLALLPSPLRRWWELTGAEERQPQSHQNRRLWAAATRTSEWGVVAGGWMFFVFLIRGEREGRGASEGGDKRQH